MTKSGCLFLAPHLDDVPLSCSLRLLEEQRRGNSVLVATVFSSGLSLLPGTDFYLGRRREDRNALAILGVDNPIWLGFHDAPYRTWCYWNFESIVMKDHHSNVRTLEKITQRVVSLCEKYAPEKIFLPLAIGTHIDHRLVHQMWCQLSSQANIVFYEDRPYVFLPQSLAIRMKQIHASPFEAGLVEAEPDRHRALQLFAQGLNEISLYKDVIKTKRVRFLYTLWAARKLKMASEATKLKLEPEIVATEDPQELTRISSAIGAYTSQMKMLWDKTLSAFDKESRAYAHTLQPSSLYAERYWKLVQ